MKYLLVGLLILVLVVPLLGAGCGDSQPGPDERQLTDLVKQVEGAFNDEDWYTLYQTMSPNYKATCSYEEYDEFSQGARAMWLALFGPGNIELIDISVRVEGEWAYVIYKMVRDGEVLVELTSINPDIYRKVGGRWYDVAEDPMEPGYNVDDVP